MSHSLFLTFFFFNDTATTEIYTLSLHDALPILVVLDEEVAPLHERRPHLAREERVLEERRVVDAGREHDRHRALARQDRKSTRLNSSHGYISYAVFCLKKKKKHKLPKDNVAAVV